MPLTNVQQECYDNLIGQYNLQSDVLRSKYGSNWRAAAHSLAYKQSIVSRPDNSDKIAPCCGVEGSIK